MDSFWMLEVNVLALLLIVPTLLCNLVTVRYLTRFPERLVAWAMNCWLAMNIAWMTADILNVQAFYFLAKVFTGIGFLLLVVVVLGARQSKAALRERLRRFRRLRISVKGFDL